MIDPSKKLSPEQKESKTSQAHLFDAPSTVEQRRMVEAILFASSEPVSVTELESRMPQGSNPGSVVDELKTEYSHRGVNLVKIGGGWAMRTSPDLSFLMRKETVETRKLSRAAVETLAIIAYHQPVTRLEIEEIRGVGVKGYCRFIARNGLDKIWKTKNDTRTTSHFRCYATFLGSLWIRKC